MTAYCGFDSLILIEAMPQTSPHRTEDVTVTRITRIKPAFLRSGKDTEKLFITFQEK